MKLIRSIHSPHLPRDGCALTIGNFDAVHIGHRKILQTLVAQSRQRGLPAAVMTFDPHPQEYFSRQGARPTSPASPASAPPRLTATATRYFALRECGVDIMLSLNFNGDLARTDAVDFIRRYLVDRLRVKYLLVGDDFRFGAKRAGDFKLLAEIAPQHGCQVARFHAVQRYGERVSSTRIRALLACGDLHRAAQLLGRNYAHAGRVIHGHKRGREWGFPTINLAIRHQPALAGVFAVTVSGLAEHAIAGVASLGQRPTLRPVGKPQSVLEVFLFDYAGDAYGRRVCVEFVKKIRDEEKFESYDALIARIAEDARIAKTLLEAAEK